MTKSIRDTQLSIISTVLMGRNASVLFCGREGERAKFRVFPRNKPHINKPFTFDAGNNGCAVTFEIYGRVTTLRGLSNVVTVIKALTEAQK